MLLVRQRHWLTFVEAGRWVVRSHVAAARGHDISADELDSALSRLAELRDRGLLAQTDFDAEKRELLDRLQPPCTTAAAVAG